MMAPALTKNNRSNNKQQQATEMRMSATQKARNRESVPILDWSQITEQEVYEELCKKKYGPRDEKFQTVETVRTHRDAITQAAPELVRKPLETALIKPVC